MARSLTLALASMRSRVPALHPDHTPVSDPFLTLTACGPLWIDDALAEAEAWRISRIGEFAVRGLGPDDMVAIRRETT
jgi:hypothetical protein